MFQSLLLAAVLLFVVAMCMPQGDKSSTACVPGYNKDTDTYDDCPEVCTFGNCTNGFCLSSGDCQCKLGYIYNKDTGDCDIRVCGGRVVSWYTTRTGPSGCRNGYCNEDYTCSCNTGYYPDYDNHNNCEPEYVCRGGCKNLPNGICTAGGCAQTCPNGGCEVHMG